MSYDNLSCPWLPKATRCIELNTLQRRMTAAAIGRTRLSIESWVEFKRNSCRDAAIVIETNGRWWSQMWLQRALRWDRRLQRDFNLRCALSSKNTFMLAHAPSLSSFACILSRWHAKSWLDARRVFEKRGRGTDMICSRTRTRATRSFVQTRWHEGVDYALLMCPDDF